MMAVAKPSFRALTNRVGRFNEKSMHQLVAGVWAIPMHDVRVAVMSQNWGAHSIRRMSLIFTNSPRRFEGVQNTEMLIMLNGVEKQTRKDPADDDGFMVLGKL